MYITRHFLRERPRSAVISDRAPLKQAHLACFPRIVAGDTILVSGFGLGRSGHGRVEAKEDRLSNRRGCGTLGLDRWLVGGWQVDPAASWAAGSLAVAACAL